MHTTDDIQNMIDDTLAGEQAFATLFQLDALSDEQRSEAYTGFMDMVLAESIADILDTLSDEDIERVNALLAQDETAPQGIVYLLSLPSAPDIIQATANRVIAEALVQLPTLSSAVSEEE